MDAIDKAAYRNLYGDKYFAQIVNRDRDKRYIINWGAVEGGISRIKGVGAKSRKENWLKGLNEWLEYCNGKDTDKS